MWGIPGFLGLPSDWNFLENVTPVDTHAFQWNSLSNWGAQFNQQIKSPSILIGYSLGGRLALHALLNNPKLWKGAVIISTHPGLTDSNEKIKRLEHDRRWAKRFEQEEWGSLMDSWNSQEVFSHDLPIERKEKDYQRSQLAQTLLNGSLRMQEDLRYPISQLDLPILWMTGSKDDHYSKLAQSLAFKHPLSKWIKVEGAGHRIPWSKPVLFKEHIVDFISLLH